MCVEMAFAEAIWLDANKPCHGKVGLAAAATADSCIATRLVVKDQLPDSLRSLAKIGLWEVVPLLYPVVITGAFGSSKDRIGHSDFPPFGGW